MPKHTAPTPRIISLDAEYDALSFLFLRYSLCHDLDATCSFFSILPRMYAKSTMFSPLHLATGALALQVTHLHHRTRGGRSSLGGGGGGDGGLLYARAVSQVKEALTVPAQCRSDELLMATLVLEAYDDASRVFGRKEDKDDGGASPSCAHLHGSIALLQYRGALNYTDELPWRLVVATRNRFLHDSGHNSDKMVGVRAVQRIWDRGYGAGRPRAPAVEADTLAIRLAALRHLYMAFLTGSPPRGWTKNRRRPIGTEDDTNQLNAIVSQASRLANDCALFQSTLPLSWQPASIPASSLPPSIRAASVYEHVTLTVYSRLSIAHSTNRQRLNELGCISLIADCLARTAALGEQLHHTPLHQRGLLPSSLLARAQVLLDGICATVPFLTGDVTAGAEASSAVRHVLVPSVSVQASSERASISHYTLPDNKTKHAQQVVASGLYMMYTTLTAALDLAGGDKLVDTEGNSLRAGQDEWMVGQVNRLKDILPLARCSDLDLNK